MKVNRGLDRTIQCNNRRGITNWTRVI